MPNLCMFSYTAADLEADRMGQDADGALLQQNLVKQKTTQSMYLAGRIFFHTFAASAARPQALMPGLHRPGQDTRHSRAAHQ